MINIKDLCDYIIVKSAEAGSELSNLKMQKLAYYADAWHLAFYNEKLIDENFQAWIHGPVSRQIYDRFLATKSLYSEITISDCSSDFDESRIASKKAHIDSVLEAYGKFTGAQLEEMTHREEPWIKAREGYRSTQRCEAQLDNDVIRDYYKQRLA
ncbi:Panacea domain-containing protein [Duffyella gerundensis]|uniref:Panacea domain-containing protein n=1 Tax=Duffyella gerundensis TaxID=1619313 RepID=UPI001654733A|nr:type II toxin-antitoxin system antitoxin SocA domain-containing protein [Duffyella gerundensis]